MSNEKEILLKLLTIAKNQQKVIHKLAQAQGLADADPNISYLRDAVNAAAANSGVTVPIGTYVAAKNSNQQSNVHVEGGYIVTITGLEQVDNKLKERFLHTYLTQVKNQKPELDGKISVVFA